MAGHTPLVLCLRSHGWRIAQALTKIAGFDHPVVHDRSAPRFWQIIGSRAFTGPGAIDLLPQGGYRLKTLTNDKMALNISGG